MVFLLVSSSSIILMVLKSSIIFSKCGVKLECVHEPKISHLNRLERLLTHNICCVLVNKDSFGKNAILDVKALESPTPLVMTFCCYFEIELFSAVPIFPFFVFIVVCVFLIFSFVYFASYS